MEAWWTWTGTSCSPRDGCAVFLGLHTQRSYAGRFTVWINIEIIAINSTSHCRTSKKAPHMCLSHMAAAWTGHTQEVSDTCRTVRVRWHARGDGITRHNTTWHRWCSAAAPNPCRVLDLKKKKGLSVKVVSLSSITILNEVGPDKSWSLQWVSTHCLTVQFSNSQFLFTVTVPIVFFFLLHQNVDCS